MLRHRDYRLERLAVKLMAERAYKIANSILRRALDRVPNLIASIERHLLKRLVANSVFFQNRTMMMADRVAKPLDNQRIALSLATLRGSIERLVFRHLAAVTLLYAAIACALDLRTLGIAMNLL